MRSFKQFWRPFWLCLILLGILWVAFFALQLSERPIEVTQDTPLANRHNVFHQSPNEQYVFNKPKKIGLSPVLPDIRSHDDNKVEIRNHIDMKNNSKNRLNLNEISDNVEQTLYRKSQIKNQDNSKSMNTHIGNNKKESEIMLNKTNKVVVNEDKNENVTLIVNNQTTLTKKRVNDGTKYRLNSDVSVHNYIDLVSKQNDCLPVAF